jgi:hypothetical protein
VTLVCPAQSGLITVGGATGTVGWTVAGGWRCRKARDLAGGKGLGSGNLFAQHEGSGQDEPQSGRIKARRLGRSGRAVNGDRGSLKHIGHEDGRIRVGAGVH